MILLKIITYATHAFILFYFNICFSKNPYVKILHRSNLIIINKIIDENHNADIIRFRITQHVCLYIYTHTYFLRLRAAFVNLWNVFDIMMVCLVRKSFRFYLSHRMIVSTVVHISIATSPDKYAFPSISMIRFHAFQTIVWHIFSNKKQKSFLQLLYSFSICFSSIQWHHGSFQFLRFRFFINKKKIKIYLHSSCNRYPLELSHDF